MEANKPRLSNELLRAIISLVNLGSFVCCYCCRCDRCNRKVSIRASHLQQCFGNSARPARSRLSARKLSSIVYLYLHLLRYLENVSAANVYHRWSVLPLDSSREQNLLAAIATTHSIVNVAIVAAVVVFDHRSDGTNLNLQLDAPIANWRAKVKLTNGRTDSLTPNVNLSAEHSILPRPSASCHDRRDRGHHHHRRRWQDGSDIDGG